SSSSHFLRFRFYKSAGSFDELYGSTVKITDAKGKIQFQHYDPQRGLLSTMEHALHFGTGNETVIPKVEITFPSQKKIVLENVKADQELKVYESDAVNMNTTIAVKK